MQAASTSHINSETSSLKKSGKFNVLLWNRAAVARVVETGRPQRALAVIPVVLSFMNSEGQFWSSPETIAQRMGVSRRTALYALSDLVSCNVLEKEKRWRKGGGQKTSLYSAVISPDAVQNTPAAATSAKVAKAARKAKKPRGSCGKSANPCTHDVGGMSASPCTHECKHECKPVHSWGGVMSASPCTHLYTNYPLKNFNYPLFYAAQRIEAFSGCIEWGASPPLTPPSENPLHLEINNYPQSETQPTLPPSSAAPPSLPSSIVQDNGNIELSDSSVVQKNGNIYGYAPDGVCDTKRAGFAGDAVGVTAGAVEPEAEAFALQAEAPQPPAAKAKAKAKAGRCRRQLPEDWAPGDRNVLWVKSHYEATDAQIAREAAKFGDYHRSRGNLMADWDAAWRTWWQNDFHKIPRKKGPASANGKGGDDVQWWLKRKPTDDLWRQMLRKYANGSWSRSHLGEPPAARGCIAPRHIIVELGLENKYDEYGISYEEYEKHRG